MMCPNCGNTISNNNIFCDVCGVRLSTVNDTPNPQLPQTSNFTDEVSIIPEPSPKKKWKKPLIICAIIFLFSIITIYAAPYVTNTFVKTVTDSDDYFRYVIKKNVKSETNEFLDSLQTLKETLSYEKQTSALNTKLSVGEGMEELIDDIDDNDIDDIYDYIRWLESAEINIKATSEEKSVNVEAKAFINDCEVANANTIVNDEEIYIAFPFLNDEYICTQLEEVYGDDTSEFLNTQREFADALPSKEISKRLINKYLECILENAEGVSEKKTTIEAGGVSQKVTELTLEIDDKYTKKTLESVLNELEDDQDIKKIIKDFCEIDAIDLKSKDVYDSFSDAVDELLEDIDEIDFDGCVDFSIYVDARGDIKGIYINASLSDERIEITYLLPKKGNRTGELLCVESPDIEYFSLEGSLKERWNRHSGEYVICVAEFEIFKLQANKLDTKKLDEGIFDGEITVKTGDDVRKLLKLSGNNEIAKIIDDLKITLESKESSKKKSKVLIGVYYDDLLCASLNINEEELKHENISVPTDYVDATDTEAMIEWIKDFDYDFLIDSLKEADVSSEIIEMIEEFADQQ